MTRKANAQLPAWELHHRILGMLGMLVALGYLALVLGVRDDDYSGLVIVIVAGVTLVGAIPYVALSTFLVHRASDRRGVVHAHLASLAMLALLFGALLFSFRR